MHMDFSRAQHLLLNAVLRSLVTWWPQEHLQFVLPSVYQHAALQIFSGQKERAGGQALSTSGLELCCIICIAQNICLTDTAL